MANYFEWRGFWMSSFWVCKLDENGLREDNLADKPKESFFMYLWFCACIHKDISIITLRAKSLSGSVCIFRLNTEIILGLLEDEWFNVEKDPHDPVNQHEDHGDTGVRPKVKSSVFILTSKFFMSSVLHRL